PQVNPTTVGALIALYERAVSFYASLVNINAYHQPGVEAGKKAAASILALQKSVLAVLQSTAGAIAIEELAVKAQAGDQVETVYKIVRHLAANDRWVHINADLQFPSRLTVSWQA
ncbi:MAG: glucose-6-phosphate isomerase, partial [Synechocystis sp.]